MLIIVLVLFIGAAIAGLQATMGAGDNPWPPVLAASVGAAAGLIVFGTLGGAMFYAILCMGAWLAALAVVPEPPQRAYWSPRASSSLHLPSQGSTCEFCAGEVPGDTCIYCRTKKGEKIRQARRRAIPYVLPLSPTAPYGSATSQASTTSSVRRSGASAGRISHR